MRPEARPVETTVQHTKELAHEWTVEIHDDPMRFDEWKDAFDEAAELIRRYPFGATEASVHFIDPNLLVIRVVIEETA